ncbi:MAG: PAS domain-containing protein, partial [Deltaproteobacteria bacterium]
MKDPSSTHPELIEEISRLQQKIQELEQSESERKLAEKELRKADKMLHVILDTIPAMIWQKDLEGRYLQVNNAYCGTVGLPIETILGKTDYDLYPQEIADKYVSHDRKILSSGKSELGIEEYHRKPSGEYGWSVTDKLAYMDDKGNIEGTIGFAVDITKRKQAEKSLLES